MQPQAKPLDPIDPNIKLPRAAREAAAQAEAYYKKPELAQAPAPEDPPKPPEPPAEPPAAPDKVEAAEVVVADAPPLPPAQEPPAPQPEKQTNWEHAYKSMKGRYERSEQAVSSLRAQLAELQQVVAASRAQPRQDQKKDDAPEQLITDKDIEDYGQDLLNVVGKRAKEELNPLVRELRAEIAQLRGQLQGTAQKVTMTAQERMYSQLDQAVPNWRTLNKNQDFLNWLALPDGFSGVIRQVLLDDAVEQNSAPRVAAFFQGFLAEEAASGSGASVDPAPAPVQAPHQPAIALESLAAPGRAKSAATHNVPAEKPIITNAQISQFYVDVRRGLYRGREAEKDATERMISEAAREGRVR